MVLCGNVENKKKKRNANEILEGAIENQEVYGDFIAGRLLWQP